MTTATSDVPTQEMVKESIIVTATAAPASPEGTPRLQWADRINAQDGPWDQVRTPEMLKGAPSLPMPVQVAEPVTLAPYFSHLSLNGTHEPKDLSISKVGLEPYYNVPFAEFEKGVVYADRRLDLCKMVVGPLNIGPLMDSLEGNTFIEHFLLGNNIIGPAGARRIAKFIHDHPDRMDTWYLAGNCIDAAGWDSMANGLIGSRTTNVWLKRNPLGPSATPSLARYIIGSKHLRTLDLDQTELGDSGVASLFDALLSSPGTAPLTLQHLYLNATGVGPAAAASINRFLRSGRSQLVSLYLANNPLGDDGIVALTDGLREATSLQRLMLSSVGMTSVGATALCRNLKGHPALLALDVGQSYATEDLGARFNWIEDGAVPAIVDLIAKTPVLRYLVLGYTAISHQAMNDIYAAVAAEPTGTSARLCWFFLQSVLPAMGEYAVVKARQAEKRLRPRVKAQLHANVAELYAGMSYEAFEADEKRWLAGPKEDLRKIDSVYRNRDAGMARRGLKVLDKWWKENDDTLEEVMAS